MKNLKYVFLALLATSSTGCLLAAAGAGVEAGYVGSQDETVGETLDDQRISTTIKTQMLADSEVSGLSIDVDTFKRVVTLKGIVRSQHEARKALDIAKSVSGVRWVRSELSLQ